MRKKLLLFDLDGTLLRENKTISEEVLKALQACRKRGYLIGISTSRSEQNSLIFLKEVEPDIQIVSSGALIKCKDQVVYKAAFTEEQTTSMIEMVRRICGPACEMTVDTMEGNYWNYTIDPKQINPNWGESIWTDYQNFHQECLKMSIQIFQEEQAKRLEKEFPDCDMVKFSDGDWYKVTKKNITKESALSEVCRALEIQLEDIIAFGDDHVDIGMLKAAGVGIAMGNAIDEVKAIADQVIGTNEEDGIAKYLELL